MAGAKQISKSQCRELKTNPGYYLRDDAAIAWDNASRAFGKKVLITGSWRSYETQERIFRERYQLGGWSPVGDYRTWKGQTWARVRGAAAAVPGTSNHGGGVAVDVQTSRRAGDPPYSKAVVFTSWSDKDRVRWLAIAKKFGWTADEGIRVGELWHMRYDPKLDRYRGKIINPDGTVKPNPKPKPAAKRKPHRIATIRQGDEGWRVLLAQQVLKDSGDYKGKLDSKFGPQMEKAVSRFQKRAGIGVDGVVGPDTWFSMTYGARPGLGQNTKHGNARAKVTQRVCGLLGDEVDGKIGKVTQKRMEEVQRWLGFTGKDVDAIWKNATKQALIKKG